MRQKVFLLILFEKTSEEHPWIARHSPLQQERKYRLLGYLSEDDSKSDQQSQSHCCIGMPSHLRNSELATKL
jgi:hypothetical protein